MEEIDSIRILVAGVQTLFTPALFLSAVLLTVAGLSASRRRPALDHVITFVLVAVLFSLALAKRGPSSLDPVSRWIVVGAGLLLLDAGRRRVKGLNPAVLVWAILLGAIAILLRANIYGPVLSALEGPWQTSSSFGELWLYHLGAGLGLGVTYVVGVLAGRRVPAAVSDGLGVVTALAVILIAGLNQIDAVQRQLLLRWPPSTWG